MRKSFLIIIMFFASITTAEESLSALREPIIIATHIEPPFIYIENNQFVGRNVEVAQLLLSTINKEVTFVQCPFARCLAMTIDGTADMMIAINRTYERENSLTYLAKPFSTHITPVKFFLAKNSNIEITHYNDLQNLSIGVLRGASFFKLFDNDFSLNKIDVTTHEQLVDLLLKGRVDTFLAREISIKTRVPEDIYQQEMKLAEYTYHKKADAHIAISKKSPLVDYANLLSDNLNKLIESGEIEVILKKYQ